jgi:hypothetical protein
LSGRSRHQAVAFIYRIIIEKKEEERKRNLSGLKKREKSERGS